MIFKIKKILRYLKLYGARRTWIKVRGQIHLNKRFQKLPSVSLELKPQQKVAIAGCGNFAFTTIAYYLRRKFGNVIGAVMDVDINRAASLAQYHKVPFFTDDFEAILNNEHIEMIYIASDHASHAEYAIKALQKGKHVYIEKPHVVSEEQLQRLMDEIKKKRSKVFLGFNRPSSYLGRLIFQYLNAQQGAGIYNWFVVGHKLEADHWYLKPGEGGRVLGNLCHWTDFLLYLIPNEQLYPIEINPTRGEKADIDIAVSFKFGDGSIAAITFSEKGDSFEGVREKFHAQKGDCILSLDDFQTLVVDINDKKYKHRMFYRNQGHYDNIVNAYLNVFENRRYDFEKMSAHIFNSAWLFLKTKEALENDERFRVEHIDLT